eukprot:GHRQ01026851.1.p2 GENE.GHRQ01026851.1~~GHRQ01026851.1.p2  ORF type:complete len:118 (+),score=2.76 GHRQ01026851.1:474-827(+)
MCNEVLGGGTEAHTAAGGLWPCLNGTGKAIIKDARANLEATCKISGKVVHKHSRGSRQVPRKHRRTATIGDCCSLPPLHRQRQDTLAERATSAHTRKTPRGTALSRATSSVAAAEGR